MASLFAVFNLTSNHKSSPNFHVEPLDTTSLSPILAKIAKLDDRMKVLPSKITKIDHQKQVPELLTQRFCSL